MKEKGRDHQMIEAFPEIIWDEIDLRYRRFAPDHFRDLGQILDRKSTRLNSSHLGISYAVFCLKKQLGENNPSGHLTVTFPRSAGTLPDFYNHHPSKNHTYVDGDDRPVFFFFYGPGDTKFLLSSPHSRSPV